MTARPHTAAPSPEGSAASASIAVSPCDALTGDNAPALEAGRSYTPGPWSVEDNVERGYGDADMHPFAIQGGGPNYFFVATVIGDISALPAEANARLIAAAPELLEALDGLVAWIDGDYADDTPEARRIMAAKLAIAKAEGRS